MSAELQEQYPATPNVGDDAQRSQPSPQADGDSPETSGSAGDGSGKLVPVSEAIKYRRRAQQAEADFQRTEQTLEDLQAQHEDRLRQLAEAEAQRDELRHQLDALQTRTAAERMLYAAGVTDVETAMALLEKRTSLSDDLDPEQLQQAVHTLLLEKAFLSAPAPSWPDKTASARLPGAGAGARLSRAANRAAQTGSRRHVAEYLRLRRHANTTY